VVSKFFVLLFSVVFLLCCDDQCVLRVYCRSGLGEFIGLPRGSVSFMLQEVVLMWSCCDVSFLPGFLLTNWTILFSLINRLRQSFCLHFKKKLNITDVVYIYGFTNKEHAFWHRFHVHI
jgi:hypothetical protein